MDLDEVVKKIESFDCGHVVFTGGEPTLYESEMKMLMFKLDGYTFEIESNGSRDISFNYFDQVTISPKLKSSGNRPYEIMALTGKYDYKFVYVKDGKEILECIKKYCLSKEKVYIMPEGVTRKAQLGKHKEVIEFCLKHGFNFSPRLQVLTYDKKRGV